MLIKQDYILFMMTTDEDFDGLTDEEIEEEKKFQRVLEEVHTNFPLT